MAHNEWSVRVDGLRQFAKDLGAIDPDFQKELKKANLDAATIVKDEAVRRANLLGGVAAFAAKSLRALGYQREGSIRGGGKSREGRTFFGAEYGSLRWHQFKPWRGNGKDAGFFMWPSIRDSADTVADQYGFAFETVAHKAFPEGRPSHDTNGRRNNG